ncbi:MAG: AsmA family protein [Alphaproteobacteria bacterium]|nr:AsmA family protein [Alphaproteobacteria bacterium]
MRKLLIGLAAAVVVLVAAILVVPSFIDWNGYKPEIQAAVKDATGRDLTIGGDLSLAILPSPSLSVQGVALSNITGGAPEPMARLAALRVNVALGPLISGDIRVTSVTLVEPTIVLERLADGRANWELATAASDQTTASTDAGASTGAGPAIALDAAIIENGTLIYRDASSGTEHRIEGLNAEISAGSLKGPFEVKAALSYSGLPVTVTGSVGALDSGRPTALTLSLGLDGGAGTAILSGALDLDAGPGFKGDLALQAPDAGKAAGSVMGAFSDTRPALPGGLSHALAMTAKIAGSAEAVTLDDLVLTLGDSRLQGGVAVALAETPTVDVRLQGNRLDLDALLPAGVTADAGATGAPSTTGQPSSAAVTAPAFTLPTGIAGSVEFAIDAVQVFGASVRTVRLDADLVDGALGLKLATAQLPGGTQITATGTALNEELGARFTGRVEAVSDNLRGTLDWLKVDLNGIAADRLRKASLTAAIDATAEQIQITDWIMELDATRAQGGLTLALRRERPAFGLSLVVDQINVDAYLPAGADDTAAAGGKTASPATGTAGSNNPLAPLIAFDANVNVKVGEATVTGIPIRDARLDVLLQNGTLTLRDVGAADFGGARATVSGSLRDAATKPSVDLSFDVAVTSVERFARLLSADVPISAKQLGKVQLTGTATGDMEDVKVDVALALAGGRFGIKGTAKPLTAPPRLDLAYSLSHPDAKQLAGLFAPGALDGVGALGAIEGSGTLGTRDDGRYSNQLSITVAGGSIGLIGNADVLAPVPDVDMAIEISHPDVVRAIRIAAPGYKPAGKALGGLTLRTRFQGPVDNLRLFETELMAGALRATGDGAVDSRGARPALTLALTAGRVEVDPWLPPEAPKPAGAAPVAPVPATNREWSRDRIDFSGLSALDADLTASFEAIVYGAYIVDNARLAATLKDGMLTLSKLAGGMFGGTFEMTGHVADRPTPTAALVVKVRDADVRQAAQTAADTGKVRGIMTYDTDLQTRGDSELAMVSNLGGAGSFNVRDGAVEGFNLRMFSDQLKQLNDASAFLQLAERSLGGGETTFRSLAGSYTVTKGVLRSNDIKLDADAGAGDATAVVDLPPRQMDVNAKFRLSEHPNAPPVGIRITGSIDNPRQIFDINDMQAYVLQQVGTRTLKQLDKSGTLDKLLGNGQSGGGTTAPSGDGASQPAAPKLEDIGKGLLKGLLKK